MQICIHRKDNSPKPVNHGLTLEKGPKVKSDHIRRFPGIDIRYFGFTSSFNLEEGPKVKSVHTRRFPVHGSYMLVYHPKSVVWMCKIII